MFIGSVVSFCKLVTISSQVLISTPFISIILSLALSPASIAGEFSSTPPNTFSSLGVPMYASTGIRSNTVSIILKNGPANIILAL